MPSSASARRLQQVAVLLVALALAAIAVALYASQRFSAQRGPWALAVLPEQIVWLSVDEQLWRLNAHGKREASIDTRQSLGGAVGVLAAHPSGQLVAWVRQQTALHVLDARSGQARQRINPQWPADLRSHADEAIHLAFAPDGRFAIATGGSHAVVLFDAAGRMLARTPANTYVFTNALWWADDDWWTTDTNRMALVRLDGETMSEKSRIPLTQRQSAWLYLAEAAAPSHGAPRNGRQPLATIARMSNGMKYGRMSDVFADGSQADYAQPAAPHMLAAKLGEQLAPRAAAWLGDQLLVTDGVSRAVRVWDRYRRQQADWGDAATQAALAQISASHQRWHTLYLSSLGLAGLLLAAGLLLSRQAERLKAAARKLPPPLPAVSKGSAPLQRPMAVHPPPDARRSPQAWSSIAVSLLVPGAAQYQQGRRGAALFLFTLWLLLSLQLAWVLWMDWGARASVSRAFIWLSCWLWLMPGLVSAGNAWQMRQKQMSARGGRHS